MAEWSWPCPRCGQTQRVRAQAGEEVNTRQLCAACAEEVGHQLAEDDPTAWDTGKESGKAEERRAKGKAR